MEMKSKIQTNTKVKPSIRYLKEIKDILYDKEWANTAPNLELYYMYRGAKNQNGLRYDITVIPPKTLGKEFVKTKGNRNAKGFLELYVVLAGEAIFLMQKVKGRSVQDALVIKAKRGDVVIEPKDYIIVTINPSKRTLKLGNWIPENNQNIYSEIEKMKGACYYYTKGGWVKNEHYKNIPKLRFQKPLKKIPDNLNFLYGKS